MEAGLPAFEGALPVRPGRPLSVPVLPFHPGRWDRGVVGRLPRGSWVCRVSRGGPSPRQAQRGPGQVSARAAGTAGGWWGGGVPGPGEELRLGLCSGPRAPRCVTLRQVAPQLHCGLSAPTSRSGKDPTNATRGGSWPACSGSRGVSAVVGREGGK